MPVWNGADPDAVARAAARLVAGELIAFATETVYGLGARADRDDAVAKIYAAKGRPAAHPLIVHVADVAAARAHVADWPDAAEQLAQRYWPGPVTLIVPRADGVCTAAAGAHATIGLRCPAHPVARTLLVAAAAQGVAGIAAPSANRYGRISPTTAEHVAGEFGPDLVVLDGGPCDIGIESTIVDLSTGRARLLRPGSVSRQQLEAALGTALGTAGRDAPRAPGSDASHYAPRAELRLYDAAALQGLLAAWPPSASAQGIAVYSRHAAAGPPGLMWKAMPADPHEAARRLYADLRELDDAGVTSIWVEAVPASADWDGVRDRLSRAATKPQVGG